ncbi:MAG: DNA polymerase III subunit delta [Parachlamydiaceae bacterium]|nr:DNA polymerase III subunit delta [Parachlamydiaceae bacterium]
MKYNNLRAFEKHLEGAAPQHFSDIYMILAKEDYERKSALDLLIKIVLKKEVSPDLCLQIFDAEKHTVDNVLSELEMLAFFAKKRLIVVHNADKFEKASALKMESYFNVPNRSACLVLIAPSVNRATNFYKKAEKVGIILDIAEEKPWEREKSLADWLGTAALAEGKQIEQSTCRALVKQLGTDQCLLQQELLKLVCYVGQRASITEKDVSTICGSVNSENAWQLGEAIFRRDVATALRISKALLNDGVALIALLRQIRSQFQTEFNICSILMQGGSGDEISREYPYMKGQILERHIQNARSYGMLSLKEGLLKVDQTELQAKNSSVDPDFLAEMLVIKLTSNK